MITLLPSLASLSAVCLCVCVRARARVCVCLCNFSASFRDIMKRCEHGCFMHCSFSSLLISPFLASESGPRTDVIANSNLTSNGSEMLVDYIRHESHTRTR